MDDAADPGNMFFDGTRWRRWDGHRWLDATTGLPDIGGVSPEVPAAPPLPAMSMAPQPPPAPVPGYTSVMPPTAYGQPPPMPGYGPPAPAYPGARPVALNDAFAWTLAIIPLLYGPFNLVTGFLFVFVAIGINSLLVWGDEVQLRKARVDPPVMWWVFLIPVYLFIRGERTGRGPVMGIVSLVTVVLSVFGL